MTTEVKLLLGAIQQGDIEKIRQTAIYVLKNDKTQKDACFCKDMIENLQSQHLFSSLPKEIAGCLVVEDVNKTFIPQRYFLTSENKALLDDIQAVDRVAKILTEKRIRYVNSTLLFGESGTGKTTFGRCVAYTLGAPFVYISFANLISSYLGKTGSRIKEIFDFIKGQRCVFMLDELDAIGVARGSSNEVGEISRIAISLMQALDSLENNVVLLAATNRNNDIDDAILRRFTRKVEIKELTQDESVVFAKAYLANCGYSNVDDKLISKIIQSPNPSQIERTLNSQIVQWELEKATLG